MPKTDNQETEQKPYFKYWGKAAKDGTYHLLPYHCLDVAAVGRVLLESHKLVCIRFSEAMHISENALIELFCFFMSIHDIGKFAEVFQNKRPDIKEELCGEKSERHSSQRHDRLGYIAWTHLYENFVQDELFGFSREDQSSWELKDSFNQLACCFTGHHGYPASKSDGHRSLSAKSYYSNTDFDAVFKFTKDQWLLHVTDGLTIIQSLADVDTITKASWWIAGLTVVCDWIGSDQSIFAFHKTPMDLEDYYQNKAIPHAQKALKKCGLLPSRTSGPMSLSELSDENIKPTPLQTLCETHTDFNTPQLWILEDITGAGKTEAAMLLVNRLMAFGQGNGFFIGLPTMATADGMYARMANYYQRLFKPDQHPSLVLAHGSRHLSEAFKQSIIPIKSSLNTYGKNEPTGSAECVAWLADNRKKALLADAGVGTIDQALLCILPSRHQGLRLFGLGTNILLVDEVHAYDSYMHSLLKALLTFHAHFGGSAVLLSATLPKNMRKDLIAAYQEGLNAGPQTIEFDTSYPLVSMVTSKGVHQLPVEASRRSIRDIPVHLVHYESEVIELLEAAYNSGQCACWIRNTVFDARQAYEQLLQKDGITPSDIILFHARYTLADRMRIEEQVTRTFGKKSTGDKRANKILIATQVVEQSLDLDFDEMISDLAPIDLIIQRAGRLHRHIRDAAGNPVDDHNLNDLRSKPLFHVLSPEPVDTPPANWYEALFPKAAPVYPHVGRLWLTSRILKRKGEIRMPAQLRELIEGVYAESAEPIAQALLEASLKAEGDANANAGLGQYNSLSFENGYNMNSGDWSEEIDVPTRLGENTQTVYLAKLKDEVLVSFEKGSFPWDLSSIKVAERKLKNLSPMIEEKFYSQLEVLRQSEKRITKYAIVMPMIDDGKGAWMSQGMDSREQTVGIHYESSVGLMVGDEVGGG